MFINVPEFNTSFVVPYKSGNLLIYSTLVEILKTNNIEYTLDGETDNMLENCFLFVRNPLDRFFSSYKWIIKLRAIYADETNDISDLVYQSYKNAIELFDLFEINTLNDYIKKYNSFLNSCQDTHYLPQTSFFITKTSDNGVRANLNFNFRKEYDNRFKNNNYRFIRIEEITETININNNFLNSTAFNFPFFQNETLEDKKIKKFDFLNKFPEKLNHQFMVYYMYFMLYFDTVHHNKNIDIYSEITFDEYQRAHNMFIKEILFFGYSDEIDTNKKNFKNSVI